MIRNIVFGGCSYTWGQSLHHFEDGDAPPSVEKAGQVFHRDSLKYWEYQYNVNNRYPTFVADYFCRKPIVHTENGGTTYSICKHIKESINGLTDLVFVQTTSFIRNVIDAQKISIEKQIQMYEDLVELCSKKNIPIIFIHWDWPSDYKMPESIRSRTIKIGDEYTFYHWTENERYRINEADSHLNRKAHKKLSTKIIQYLSHYNILKKYTYQTKQKI